jgi:DNA-binding NarL/FixJ family response regulator
MIKVLVVNKDEKESLDWRTQLDRAGYHIVGESFTLSEMIYVLTQEKVNLVICSANLIKGNALNVLKAVMDFFPRIKIVVIGTLVYESLSNMSYNISFKKTFDCDLNKYYSLPVEVKALLANEEKKNQHQKTAFLLGEHFLSPAETERLLTRTHPAWQPEYVVISILHDSFTSRIFSITSGLAAEIKNAYVVQPEFNETCLILENSPSMEKCFGAADLLRRYLLKETDAMFSIGISRSRKTAGELYACRKEALRAASSAHLFGQDSIVHINYLDTGDILYVYPKHKERRLLELTMDGNVPGALAMLDEIFEIIESRENLKQAFVNKIALGILVGLNISASAKVQELEKIQMDAASTGKLLAAKSVNDTYLILKESIEYFAAEMDAIIDVRREILFMEISKLKSKKKDITLDDLTKTFQTTAGFLNFAVMKNSGSDIFEFLAK